MILRTLKHPIFAGAYVFGRSETVRELDPDDPRRLKTRRKQRNEWPVLIQDHHDGYISYPRFLEIQELIRGNAMMSSGSKSSEASTAREGCALLQGLVRCGKCGRRMYVNYGGGRSTKRSLTTQYRCLTLRNRAGGRDCQLIGGKRIDQAVVEEFLQVTGPGAIESAQQAGELIRLDREETERYWKLQIEKAEYEAERARRQYDAIEPENRQVARVLEWRWNDRLRELEAVRAKAKGAQAHSSDLSEAELERAARLASDVEVLWNMETTTNRDKKRLLRCAIEEVQLTAEEKRYLVRIVWKGGAITDREIGRRANGTACTTPQETVELTRKLAEEFDDAQIARILNRQGRRSGLGNPFTKSSVRSMRGKNRIPACLSKPVRDPRHGPFTADEAAVELDVCMSTIHRWLREGLLAGIQATPGAPWRIVLTEEVRQRIAGGDAPRGWVGLTEAARQLELSKQRVAYLVKTGKLPAMRTKVGNRRRWMIDVTPADSGVCTRRSGLFDQMNNEDIQES